MVKSTPSLSCQILIIFGMLHCLKGCKGNSGFANRLALRSATLTKWPDKVAMFHEPCFKATVHQASGLTTWLKGLVTRELQAADVEPSGDIAMPVSTSCTLVASSVWNAFDDLVMNKEKMLLASSPRGKLHTTVKPC